MNGMYLKNGLIILMLMSLIQGCAPQNFNSNPKSTLNSTDGFVVDDSFITLPNQKVLKSLRYYKNSGFWSGNSYINAVFLMEQNNFRIVFEKGSSGGVTSCSSIDLEINELEEVISLMTNMRISNYVYNGPPISDSEHVFIELSFRGQSFSEQAYLHRNNRPFAKSGDYVNNNSNEIRQYLDSILVQESRENQSNECILI